MSQKFYKVIEIIGRALELIGLGSAIAMAMGVGNHWPVAVLVGLALYPTGLFIRCIADAVKNRIGNPLAALAMILILFLLSLWDFVVILVAIPFILLQFLMGPMMGIGLFFGLCVSGEYLLRMNGVRFEGVSGFLWSDTSLGVTLVLSLVALLLIIWQVKSEDHTPLLTWGSNVARWLREKLYGLYEWVIRRYGSRIQR